MIARIPYHVCIKRPWSLTSYMHLVSVDAGGTTQVVAESKSRMSSEYIDTLYRS